MAKRVNFYMVDLYETFGDIIVEYKSIKQKIISIIEENASESEKEGFLTLDLTRDNGLHYVADIFAFEGDKLFMRVSNQKPSGGYLRRNYSTNVPDAVISGKSEDKEGIEVYTYALLDYETGIFAIVNQQSAPNYRIINNFFLKYAPEYYMKFLPIPNKQGIDRIYAAKETQITQVEVEVPIPNANILEQLFGWNPSDILDIQGNELKAVMKLSGVERKSITENEEESRGLIDCIKDKLSTYHKARIRAKAEGIKTQDYSFFDENFSYPIEIPTYKIIQGQKHYFSAKELIEIYQDNLQMAYNENKRVLKAISNR